MTGADFPPLATRLAAAAEEPDWRTAESRAYYAAFHEARRLLEDLGFRVPRFDRAHAYLWLRLNNSGDPGVERAARDLQSLRSRRAHADYDLHSPFRQSIAATDVRTAVLVIRALGAAAQGPTRSQITAAMRVYERDVLRDVTWQGP